MIELNYKVYGQGDPIIILHGLFGSLDNWVTFAKKLADTYSVYLIDQRDHGKSPHTDEFDYSILADDLYQFMESNWIYKAHLVGHSMGGKTVMEFANQYPEFVESLTVVDIAPKYYKPRHTKVFDAINAVDLSHLENRMDAMQELQSKLDNATAAFLTKNIKRTKEGFRWKMNVPLLMKHYEDISHGIELDPPFSGKTLFVKGGDSGYIQEEDYEDIQSKFEQVTFKTIADAGHWVHAQKPEELKDILLEFIES